MMVNFRTSRAILLAAARRHAHGDHGWNVFRLAHTGRCCGRTLDSRADRGLAVGVLLPAGGRHGLLFDADTRPLPSACWHRYPSGLDCSLAVDQPADGFAATRTRFEGSHSSSASSYGRSTPRQTVATLCRTHCRVRPGAPQRQPFRYARIHRTHLGRACLHGGTLQVPQEVWPRSSQPRGSARLHQRCRRARTGSVATSACHSCRTPGGAAAWPAGTIAGAPLFVAPTQFAGAFLLMPQALEWLQTAQACFSDDYDSLDRGLLTSVFGLVTGLERIFHLDDMEDRGFALLTGGGGCPTRQVVGAWRRHLPWYEADAFCRRTFPWHLIEGQDALVSYDEHSLPRWTRKFHIKKGYITTRNKYMRCEKLFYGTEQKNRASCERLLSASRVPFFVSLSGPFSSCSLPCLLLTLKYGWPNTVRFPVCPDCPTAKKRPLALVDDGISRILHGVDLSAWCSARFLVWAGVFAGRRLSCAPVKLVHQGIEPGEVGTFSWPRLRFLMRVDRAQHVPAAGWSRHFRARVRCQVPA